MKHLACGLWRVSLAAVALLLAGHLFAADATSARSLPVTLIGPGDLLSVKVFDVPELDETVRVGDNGGASFPLVGSMHVAGKTSAELQSMVENEYRSRNLLQDPHVTVLVTEYATQGISIMGEVNHPGTYPIVGPHSLLNVISAAGGLTQAAGASVSIGHSEGADQVVLLNPNDPEKTLSGDISLQAGDRIVVSRASLIYVIGDVGRPGGYQMQDNGKLTVLEALALASGANRTAALNHAKIIHKADNQYGEAPINLDRLLHGKDPDRPLAANDILFIPNSKLKSAVANGFSGAIQAASTAAIYHP